MALLSNRSSSPSLLAGRTSPNSRNSEIGNPVRRSSSGNPFSKPSIVANPRSLNPITPANSPSDYPRRNSVSRENLFTSRDIEEKENGKDQSPKPIRVSSPTVGKSKKHFMSPTISAASKIAVSPKKKILGDRNEPVRSSLSFSGMKSSSLNSVNQNLEMSMTLESDANPQIPPVSNPKSSKTVRFGGVEVISGSYDDSESTYRCDLNPEVVVTTTVETDTKSEIDPISKVTIVEAPSKSYKTMNDYDKNPEIVTMAVEADAEPEVTLISPHRASKTTEFSDFELMSISNNDLDSPPAKLSLTEEVDCVNLDPSFKISPVASSMIAPLDADPSIPPYDPKTNYLSPRPQFLHYNPNRRVNRFEPGGKFEEKLFSESEFTEETDSEDQQKESEEASSNESQMEEEEEEEEEEVIDVSEQSPTERKKSSKLNSSRIFKISSLLLILFTAFFSICAVNFHDPNIFKRPSSLTMEDPSEILEFAKMNFNVLVGKLEVWNANSIAFISDVVSNFRGEPPLIHYQNQTELFDGDINLNGQCLVLSHQTVWEEENNWNAMEAMKEREVDIFDGPIERECQNIEELLPQEISIEAVERESEKEEEVELFQEIEATKVVKDEREQEEELLQENEAMMKVRQGIENIERESQNEEEEQEEVLFQEAEAEASDPKDSKGENEEAFEESLQEIIEEASANSASDQLSEEVKENFKVSSSSDYKSHDPNEQEATTTVEKNTELQYQSPRASPPPSGHQSDFEEENGGKIIDPIGTETGISQDFTQNTNIILSAILLALSLIVPAGLIYARKSGSKQTSMVAITEEKKEQPLLKENDTNQSPVEEEEGDEEAMDDEHDDHDDMAEEFCSSETSSFQYSSKRQGGTEDAKRSSEVQSHSHGERKRRNSRRESMASSLDEYSVSTSASPSYGSFTTFEKIPIKHGNGEDEIVTPVRRSSRIRKQHNNS